MLKATHLHIIPEILKSQVYISGLKITMNAFLLLHVLHSGRYLPSKLDEILVLQSHPFRFQVVEHLEFANP